MQLIKITEEKKMKHILTIEQLQQGKYYWWINKTNSTII
jgi:hypothetical protein